MIPQHVIDLLQNVAIIILSFAVICLCWRDMRYRRRKENPPKPVIRKNF
jgi:flagellar biosynthesis/type III secretory pathway M-ring protein FliF/YscJ